MADEPRDSASGRARPAPTRDGAAGSSPNGLATSANGRDRSAWPTRRRTGFGRLEAQQGQVVAAAGNAIVTAARVGRLLGRSSWRMARQLPGVDTVEKQAEKLRQAAAAEILRMLELPTSLIGNATPEEQRVMMLVHNGSDDAEPLRSAMTELLQRAQEPDGSSKNRDYLYGTIVSQLVPDEARILAALAGGRTFALVDVAARSGRRSPERTVLTDVSTVGETAGVTTPANTPTYLGRLRGFGLLDSGPEGGRDLVGQYVQLADDPAVTAARNEIEKGRQGSVRLVRKTVQMSTFGAEFWKACAPSRAAIDQRSG
ncbi:Abi-alpha family protein [uncultured Jatrophihabitans sp.]|uniref:Abi-alpha family protein n=1 Tax=uncultured Jatrophihabitans sp. TaxID=1610747 RepID=UPI0035CBF721